MKGVHKAVEMLWEQCDLTRDLSFMGKLSRIHPQASKYFPDNHEYSISN
jgi:hypothetical protein